MLLVDVGSLTLLVGISCWVWRDAIRRDMNPRWGIAVGLALIVFLPLYLLIRKPVKCGRCGKEIPASLAMCEECEQLSSNEESVGRSGRIFG
jgi:hypothetical protein